MSQATLTNSQGFEFDKIPIPVYLDESSSIALAKSDDPDTLAAFFIVATSTSEITIQDKGECACPDHDLVVGQYYYLSDSVAGHYQPHPGFVDQPIFYVVDDTTIKLLSVRPIYKTSFRVTE